MLKHVDLTAGVQRTHEEMRHIGYSIDEINAVVPGYPELDDRLYVAAGAEIPFIRGVILGREVDVYDIPPGPHQATNSSYRTATLANEAIMANLLHGRPDPDLPNGSTWRLSGTSQTVIRAIADGCRDFTRHWEPLVPGWRQLLTLQAEDGRPLGMPTGIGWYAHYWFSDMTDAVNMRLSEDGDDLEVLLYKRAADNQSEWVWSTSGGYMLKSDTFTPGTTPLEAATIRTSADADRTGFDVSPYRGVLLRTKYPISSGNTLVAGLRTSAMGRLVTDPDYEMDPGVNETTEGRELTKRAAGWVSIRALVRNNPAGGVSGKDHGDNLFPIWTTHFEYVSAGLDALCEPEKQHRFGMDDRTFNRVSEAVGDLRSQHEILRAA